MPYHMLIGKIMGTLYVKVKTNSSEKILSLCQKHKIIIWNVKEVSENEFIFHLYLAHANKLQQLIENHQLNIEISERKVSGLYPLIKKVFERKSLILITIVCLLFLFLISNIVWKVNISGVNIEQQEKINHYLNSVGIKKGNFIFNLPKTEEVQNEMLVNMGELLYVSIEKNGTTVNVEAKEKKLTKPKIDTNYKQLVAKKSGLIDKVFIKHGFPIVQANDYVNKGDLLATNKLENEDEDVPTNHKEENNHLIVDGEVYANTWYEVTVSTPLSFKDEKLYGQKKNSYRIKYGKHTFPLWPLKHQISENNLSEIEEIDLHFLHMNLPIKLIKRHIYNIEKSNIEQSIKLTKEYAIQQAINHLQLKLGMNTNVKHYFILEESVDENKVNLSLFVSVVEDIALGK